jgi:hypothetical protein
MERKILSQGTLLILQIAMSSYTVDFGRRVLLWNLTGIGVGTNIINNTSM